MKKLTRKNCERIAKLFNSITVAESMKRKAKREREVGQLNAAEFNEKYDLWDRSVRNSVDILADEFGVIVIASHRDPKHKP